MNEAFWKAFANLMNTRPRQPGKGSSKPRPNTKERYNAQPFAGPPFTKAEAEKVAAKRATRFTRWMRKNHDTGAKPPRHIAGD